jgi:23S rRNA (uracil1939-C5)-methyltransferase
MAEKKTSRKPGKYRKEPQIEANVTDRKQEGMRKRKTARKPEMSQTPETRRKQETTGKRETPRKSEMSQTPEARRKQEATGKRKTARKSEMSQTPEARRKQEAPGKREMPRKSEMSPTPQVRRKQEAPGKREMPRKSEAHQNRKDACIYAKKCGGCDYQGMEYAAQLKEKQQFVQKNIGEFCKVRPIIGMEQPYHYRNKVHAVFDVVKGSKASRGKNSAPVGSIISGVYKAGTHDVINIDSCLIEDEKSSAIIRDIRGLLRSFKIKTYDEDTGYGLLRHVLVRRGFQSGEIMVVLVLGSPVLPSKNNLVKALRKLHPEITTVVVNINDKKTSMVLGERETAIYGKGFIEDTLCGCTFRISPKSFYQVNPVQTEVLYNKAIEYAGLTGKEKVVDAYCGIGTIGLIAASRAKEVISVELNRDAVKDAITNAKRNQIANVQFYNADAGTFMVEMAEDGAQVDVVFMDPPRAGSDEAFLSSVVTLAPKRVVYVSCNPETLARDLKYMTKHGYRAVECTPVDMFPWTKHVETVVLMSRKDK